MLNSLISLAVIVAFVSLCIAASQSDKKYTQFYRDFLTLLKKFV
jgi:hypothetical protein